MVKQIQERVHLRVLQMPCCNHLLCWINPRLPTFCPECGQSVIRQLRIQRENILISDTTAWLSYSASLEKSFSKLFRKLVQKGG